MSHNDYSGGRGRGLCAAESYKQWWAGPPAEASGRELLAHGFVQRAVSRLSNAYHLPNFTIMIEVRTVFPNYA